MYIGDERLENPVKRLNPLNMSPIPEEMSAPIQKKSLVKSQLFLIFIEDPVAVKLGTFKRIGDVLGRFWFDRNPSKYGDTLRDSG